MNRVKNRENFDRAQKRFHLSVNDNSKKGTFSFKLDKKNSFFENKKRIILYVMSSLYFRGFVSFLINKEEIKAGKTIKWIKYAKKEAKCL